MSVIVYGIPSCDTMKKARAWLDAHGVPYRFHDYKKDGIDAATVTRWCKALGWDRVLNRNGTTFRKLPDADKVGINATKAIALMVALPSAIKRPLVDLGGGSYLAGFDADAFDAAFAT